MSGIGGLDVSFGARHQIVRTNVAVVNIDASHAMTESMGKMFFDLLHQGLAGTILEPDFICPILASDETVAAWGTGHTAVATSVFEVDTSGNGTDDATTIAKGPLLRHLSQTPFHSGGVIAVSSEVSVTQGAGIVADFEVEAGNLILEAVLNTGVCQLGAAGNATSAFGAGTVEAGSTASIALGGTGEFSGQVQSTAMAAAFNGLESGDSHTAGSPEAHVGMISFVPLAEALTDTAIQGGAVLADLNINQAAITTLLTNFETSGRAQANAATGKATFKNLIAASDGTQVVGLGIGICSTISICKVL